MEVKRAGSGGSETTPGPEDDIRALVREVTLRQQRYEQHLAAELGVDRAGLEVIDRVVSGGPATPTELARQVGISTAAMSLVLNRLESAGHISRERHPADRRKLVVTVADETAARAAQGVAPLIEGVEGLVADLSATQRAATASFLRRLLEVYGEQTPTPDAARTTASRRR